MKWLYDCQPQFSKNDWSEIGKTIRQKRKREHCSQMKLADYVGSDSRIISRHENGAHMDLETILRYAAAFECPLSDFLPVRYRTNENKLAGLTPDLFQTICDLAKLPPKKQEAVNSMLKAMLEYGEMSKRK